MIEYVTFEDESFDMSGVGLEGYFLVYEGAENRFYLESIEYLFHINSLIDFKPTENGFILENDLGDELILTKKQYNKIEAIYKRLKP